MNYIHNETYVEGKIEILNFLPKLGISNAKKEIIDGLQSYPKYISSKFFYDEQGSELFEKITLLDEYYPTRTEKKIISSVSSNLDIDFENLNIVELGSGDSTKISLLLNQIDSKTLETINYFPVDISQSAIKKSAKELSNKFELNSITGIVADFVHQLHLIPKNGKRLFCFFGSTIGNFDSAQINEFVSLLSDAMQVGDYLLIGMDMHKDIGVIEPAYNDSEGVTALFNKNILNVVNKLINSDFNTSDFDHYAYYNTSKNRIEMHLKAKNDVEVMIDSSGNKIFISKGETIHTENSHKFTSDDILNFANQEKLNIQRILTDENKWFSLVHYCKL